MISKNSFLLSALLKYNLSKTAKFITHIKYNYQFYTKPISTYLFFFFYHLISCGCINVEDKISYNISAYLNNSALGLFEKNFFKFIF